MLHRKKHRVFKTTHTIICFCAHALESTKKRKEKKKAFSGPRLDKRGHTKTSGEGLRADRLALFSFAPFLHTGSPSSLPSNPKRKGEEVSAHFAQ